MRRLALLVAAVALVSAFYASRTVSAADRLVAFAGIAPEAYFVEQVGGAHVRVHALVGPGQSPHTFEPSPRQMVALSRAALYFKIGFPFEERLLRKIAGARPDLTVVDASAGIRKRTMDEHGHHAGADGSNKGAEQREGGRAERAAEHEHHGGEPDPHIWLSPPLIKVQARNIAAALIEADPAHAADYRKNLNAFLKRVDATDARIRKALEPFKGASFYVFHPSFGYFADAYGLRQEAVEVGGKSPTAKQLAQLVRKARSEGVKVIFVQPQFSRKSAEAVADAIDGAVVPIDPLARDVLKNLEVVADSIGKALGGGKARDRSRASVPTGQAPRQAESHGT